jgi:putative endonuclease
MAKHLETGKRAEALAAKYLEEKGYEIVFRNYRYGRAEVDLIVKKDIFLVFVEVKSLTNTKFGNPEISVHKNKVRLVTKAADNFVFQTNWQQQIRFDIISIIFKTEDDFEITHFEDAFY